jgi:hypothetical protein
VSYCDNNKTTSGNSKWLSVKITLWEAFLIVQISLCFFLVQTEILLYLSWDFTNCVVLNFTVSVLKVHELCRPEFYCNCSEISRTASSVTLVYLSWNFTNGVVPNFTVSVPKFYELCRPEFYCICSEISRNLSSWILLHLSWNFTNSVVLNFIDMSLRYSNIWKFSESLSLFVRNYFKKLCYKTKLRTPYGRMYDSWMNSCLL